MNKEDWFKVLKVFCWAVGAALVAGLIAVISSPDLKLPSGVVALVPLVNTFLVGVYAWLKNNQP